MSKLIENKLKLLPNLPGCYMMKDKKNKVIYIGKAKNLKNRVRSYFKSKHEGKTERLVENIFDFETIITSNEKEAFLLEITLIKKYQPFFNIKLKRGSGYPYIKITNEKDPMLVLTNEIKNDGAYYFGPYPNVYAANETLHFLWKNYPLKRCKGFQKRPCLYYSMHQCLGACFKDVSKNEYDNQIKKIKKFLNGDVSEIKRKLVIKMKNAIDDLRFEEAAEIRDQLKYIETTVEKQRIITNDLTSRDIIAFYSRNNWISIQIFFIRQARLIKREKKIFQIISEDNDEFINFLIQFYRSNSILPKELIVQSNLNCKIISDILHINVYSPKRGKNYALLLMAEKNCKLALDEKFKLLEMDNDRTLNANAKLMKILKINDGHVIEAFDHSHIQGVDPVSAMVTFIDGKPIKKLYRKYKLNSDNGADENKNTRQVIKRRYSRLLSEHSKLPDLILIDGGVIELKAAEDILRNELKLSVPIAGMVKDNRHKTSSLIYNENGVIKTIILDKRSKEFYLLQRIQDEVHRFAITFHRRLHIKNAMASDLELIKGVGPKTRIKLLKKFKNIDGIKKASINQIVELGISRTVARSIKLYFLAD